MNRDNIIKLADEADLWADQELQCIGEYHPDWHEVRDVRFAALVRDYLLSTEIHSCHADCQRFACVQTRRAVEAEREACANACDILIGTHAMAKHCADAIRARKQQ